MLSGTQKLRDILLDALSKAIVDFKPRQGFGQVCSYVICKQATSSRSVLALMLFFRKNILKSSITASYHYLNHIMRSYSHLMEGSYFKL